MLPWSESILKYIEIPIATIIIALLIYFVIVYNTLKSSRSFVKTNMLVVPSVINLLVFIIFNWYIALLVSTVVDIFLYLIFVKYAKVYCETMESRGITGVKSKDTLAQRRTFDAMSENEKEQFRQRNTANPIKLTHWSICFLLWIAVPIIFVSVCSMFKIYLWF